MATNKSADVDEYMAKLDYPFKAEVQMYREAIKGLSKDVTEEVKWNAPSFSYKGEYLMTFNLRYPDKLHMVFHNALTPQVKCDLFEGNYPDGRRMVFFTSADDAKAGKQKVLQAMKDLMKLIDSK